MLEVWNSHWTLSSNKLLTSFEREGTKSSFSYSFKWIAIEVVVVVAFNTNWKLVETQSECELPTIVTQFWKFDLRMIWYSNITNLTLLPSLHFFSAKDRRETWIKIARYEWKYIRGASLEKLKVVISFSSVSFPIQRSFITFTF